MTTYDATHDGSTRRSDSSPRDRIVPDVIDGEVVAIEVHEDQRPTDPGLPDGAELQDSLDQIERLAAELKEIAEVITPSPNGSRPPAGRPPQSGPAPQSAPARPAGSSRPAAPAGGTARGSAPVSGAPRGAARSTTTGSTPTATGSAKVGEPRTGAQPTGRGKATPEAGAGTPPRTLDRKSVV